MKSLILLLLASSALAGGIIQGGNPPPLGSATPLTISTLTVTGQANLGAVSGPVTVLGSSLTVNGNLKATGNVTANDFSGGQYLNTTGASGAIVNATLNSFYSNAILAASIDSVGTFAANRNATVAGSLVVTSTIASAGLGVNGAVTGGQVLTVSTATTSINKALSVDNQNIARVGVSQSASSATIGGTIFYQDYTTVGSTKTNAGTGNFAFSTATIAANTLSRNGDCVVLECWGQTSANAQTKRANINLPTGPGFCAQTGAVAGNAVNWDVRCRMCRTGSNAQTIGNQGMMGSVAGMASNMTATLTDTAAFTVTCGCQNGTASDGDCSFGGFKILFEPAP